jgi:transposase-like protein
MSHEQTKSTTRNGTDPANQPEPEVVPKAKRRTFSVEYKLRILQEADRCRETGQTGALLRREGLYSSHLTTWRRQRERGELTGLAGSQRGRKPGPEAKDREIAKLSRENERLRQQLAQAELIITAQKKLAQALEQTLTGPEEDA